MIFCLRGNSLYRRSCHAYYHRAVYGAREGGLRRSPGVTGVQLKVRVGLRCLVEDLAPVIVPTSVSPKNAQGQHLLEVFHLPPRPRNLEPALHHVTMGALDRARTDGQTCRPSTLVIQVI